MNHWSLGIEMVNSQPDNGGDAFSDWQVEVTARIVRYCWAKYPNLAQVVSHAVLDPERRSDPGAQFPWPRFRQLVLDGQGDIPQSALVAAAPSMASLASFDGKVPAGLCCMEV